MTNATWARSVTPQRAAECAMLDYEQRYAEALQRASDEAHRRYQTVCDALIAQGANIRAPGTLAKRIALTLAQGDELAAILQAEIDWLNAVDAWAAFRNRNANA